MFEPLVSTLLNYVVRVCSVLALGLFLHQRFVREPGYSIHRLVGRLSPLVVVPLFFAVTLRGMLNAAEGAGPMKVMYALHLIVGTIFFLCYGYAYQAARSAWLLPVTSDARAALFREHGQFARWAFAALLLSLALGVGSWLSA